jgi:1,2-diacylglycerol 3-beta-galactosyltransferase
MFGGNGSNEMLKISKELSAHQLIFISGHNTDLAKKIESQTTLARHVAMGYVKNIEHVMQLSDYFVGKPGPGSLSEAVHMGLPVITFRSATTMPQERYNTVWVQENNLGKVIFSVRELRCAVEDLLNDLPLFQLHVQKINNTAVFEVVEALNRIMDNSSVQIWNRETNQN